MWKLKLLITPSAMLAALSLAASPSFAQERYHGRENKSGQESSGQRREQAQPRSEAPRAQAEAPRAQAEAPRPQAEAPRPQAGAPRPQNGAAPRVESRQETPRAQQPQQQQPRQAEPPRIDNRASDGRRDQGRYGSRRDDNGRNEIGRGVPRREGTYAPHYEPGYSPRYEPRYDRRGYGPRSYYRPYVFRPRYSIGFGFFSGYPVPYTYSYPYPIVVYGYRAPRERVMVSPGSPYYGGVALEMTPYDADVFVDGEYAGRVEDFDGTTQPLTLSSGIHQIDVQAQGYEPMRFNVEIQPGQVIPYRGDLRPY